MPPLDHPLVIFMLGQLLTAAGVYAAIRADLRESIVTAKAAVESAAEAHKRIDRLQERHQ